MPCFGASNIVVPCTGFVLAAWLVPRDGLVPEVMYIADDVQYQGKQEHNPASIMAQVLHDPPAVAQAAYEEIEQINRGDWSVEHGD
jgi:hypothetical protein